MPQILDPSALGPRRLEHALAPSSWKPTTVTLDGEPMQESDFDFYNDGSIDRVYKIEFNNRYMIGSELLVQRGRSASHLDLVIQNPFADPDAWLIPCQLAVGDIPLKECPPLSQKNDDASFSASKPGSMTSTIFNVRYTDLEPYRFDNVTYLVAKSFKAGTRRYVAVLKPRSDRMFSYVCLLRHDTAKRKN